MSQVRRKAKTPTEKFSNLIFFSLYCLYVETSSFIWSIMTENKFPNLSVSDHPPLETRLNKQKNQTAHDNDLFITGF